MQYKLQFNFFKIILIIGLLFIEAQCFAESSDQNSVISERSSENPTTNPKIDTDRPSIEPQEDHDTQDLEKLLDRYNRDQEAILKDAHKLHGDSDSNEVEGTEIDEMPRSETKVVPKVNDSLSEVFKAGMKSREKMKVIPTELSNSVKFVLLPLQKLSESDLQKHLDENTLDSSFRPYLKQFPNLTIFAIRLIKDPESIPAMVKILEDKESLIRFISVMISTIIFGIVLKKFMHREGRSFIKATYYFLIRFFIMLGIRIAVIYYFYSSELGPAAKVFKNTFM